MDGMFGGGVIFVVAALLWAAVLVPTWVRNREFKAAEQNAARLQRTLRVLAETAEVPTEVRVEATARQALAHERLLRTAQKQQEAERQAQLAEARAAQMRAEMRAQQMRRKQASLVRAAKLRRPWVRRVRSFSALVLLLSVVAVLVGAGFMIASMGPIVLLSGAAGFAASLGALVLLAPGRVKHAEIPAERLEERPVSAAIPVESANEAERASAAAHAAAQAAAAARIERARAMARARAEAVAAAAASGTPLRNQPESMLLERSVLAQSIDARGASAAGRQEQEATAVARPAVVRPVRQGGAAQAPASDALRRMGVIGDTSEGMIDLDQVLRTRRNAS